MRICKIGGIILLGVFLVLIGFQKVSRGKSMTEIFKEEIKTSFSNQPHLAPLNHNETWRDISLGLRRAPVLHVASSSDGSCLYAATHNSLFKLESKESFSEIFRSSQNTFRINTLFVPQNNCDKVYLATSEGLYIRERRQWQLAFTHSRKTIKTVLSVHETAKRIYVGTSRGIYVSSLQGSSWKSIDGVFANEKILKMTGRDTDLYFCDENRLYRMDVQTQQYAQIFYADSGAVASDGPENDLDPSAGNIYDLILTEEGDIWIATAQGVFLSKDQGQNWNKIASSSGLPGRTTSMAILTDSHGYGSVKGIVGTNSGAFFLEEDKWTSVYKGLTTDSINQLATDTQGIVYAATDKGLFYLSSKKTLPVFELSQEGKLPVRANEKPTHTREILKGLFAKEPTISQVHRYAIEYAEVSNSKIQTWRRQVRQRGWLPKFSVGIDGDKNKTVSDSLYGSYSQGGQSYIGPDKKTFYDNFGWGASLSWDLGDLIYNSQQTSIDSRAKLMVELREDILDQVTRLYYERQRLKIESALQENTDFHEQMDRDLRIAELTALINAMTGGRFIEPE